MGSFYCWNESRDYSYPLIITEEEAWPKPAGK